MTKADHYPSKVKVTHCLYLHLWGGPEPAGQIKGGQR